MTNIYQQHFLNLNNDFEARNDLKKSKSANNSTLSLHIAAYENSNDDTAGSKRKSEKTDLINKWNTSKQSLIGSLSFIQNPFEFPRQQEDQHNLPEVMQFKASQRLRNPNEEHLNFDERTDSVVPSLEQSNRLPSNAEQHSFIDYYFSLVVLTRTMEDSASESSSRDSFEDIDMPPPLLEQADEPLLEANELPPILQPVYDSHDCGICHQAIDNTDKKEQFSAGGFKKGDNQKTDEWIHCDSCLKWFHNTCAKVEEFETKLMETYHCLTCEESMGPSIMKKNIVPHRYEFWKEEERTFPPQVGTKPWIDDFIAKESDFPEFSGLKLYEDGNDFMNNFNFDKEWRYPLKVLKKEGLHMKLPEENFTLEELVKLVGRDEEIQVIDVYMQESNTMSMGAFFDRWNEEPRERLYNMLSFEFSHTKLMEIIRAPELMYQLSWVHKFWPPEAEPNENHIVIPEHLELKPDVAMFCLLGMGGSYTDFHIDFGGSSVWYHVFKGKKIFYVIEPTQENIQTFMKWTNDPHRSELFLNDRMSGNPMKRVVISEGETLMIPSGWIHAVYTPEDSMVFGGNFIHELNITRQLQVYDVELKCHYDEHFLFPFFELTNWYAAFHALDRFGSADNDSLAPDVIEGFRTLIPYLKKWVQRDIEKDAKYKVPNIFRNTIYDLEKLIKEYDKGLEDGTYDPEREKEKLSSLKMKIKLNSSINGSPKKLDKSYERAVEKSQKLSKKDDKYVKNIFKNSSQSGRQIKPSEWVKEAVVGFESQPGPSTISSKDFMNSFSPDQQKLIDKAAKADDHFAKSNGDEIVSSSDEDIDLKIKKKRKSSTTARSPKEPKIPKIPKPPKALSQQQRVMKAFKTMRKK
uniref:[Histone H3]-dimethyl-L-lysine(36) demethylase n=1 Tax=Panagrolaimus superbus TaxID=310955 RepID=A0A914Z116_9BILA